MRLALQVGWCVALALLPLYDLTVGLKLAVGAVLLAGWLWLNIAPRRGQGGSTRLTILGGGYRLVQLGAWLLALASPVLVLWSVLTWPGWIAVLLAALWLLVIAGGMLVNGFLRLAATSFSLGVGLRLALLFLWWLPPINWLIFFLALRRVHSELRMEQARWDRDMEGAAEGRCHTRYPIVLVHGIFFRDWQWVNYWGRVPASLKRNGATIYYGGQRSAASVEECGAELAQRVREIAAVSGKVNIIAHSKGGLDARYAISALGLAPQVASLTTICTPHRGCAFVDRLLRRLPASWVDGLARRYNRVFARLGDGSPDFLGGVRDLTVAACGQRNQELADSPLVSYRSYASRLRGLGGAPFPLNLGWLLIRDGDNDGLVTVDSARWGQFGGLVESLGRRGVSHGDMIDLSRREIKGFDVREFYIELVADLRGQGL